MLQGSLPKLPDDSIDSLVQDYGLSAKDAGTLLSLDDGERLEYFYNVIGPLVQTSGTTNDPDNTTRLGKIAGNWYDPDPIQQEMMAANHIQGVDGARQSFQRF